MSSDQVESGKTEGATMKDIRPGVSGTYVNDQGRQKAAMVLATKDSIEPNGDVVPLDEGYVHLIVFGFASAVQRASIPLRETVENNDNYYIDGKLVGYFEVA